RVYGYRYGEVEPGFDAWLDPVHPDDRTGMLEALHAARARRAEFIHEYRSLHPDGTVRYCAARGMFHYDERGQAVRMFGVMDDVTAVKEA
ncbi:PAS domain-containing protein, partial [Escherichia coli]|uniref:PAS domain-containing protein n=1 Tax=Escherichia coli TaxID=562 RepID=UPI002115145E